MWRLKPKGPTDDIDDNRLVFNYSNRLVKLFRRNFTSDALLSVAGVNSTMSRVRNPVLEADLLCLAVHSYRARPFFAALRWLMNLL